MIGLVRNTFSYFSFFTAPLQLNSYFDNANFWFGSSSPPLATSCLRTNPRPRLLIFHSKEFFSYKKFLNLKNFDDVTLHVICELRPHNQKMPAFKKILCLFIFRYNQLKNNAVL